MDRKVCIILLSWKKYRQSLALDAVQQVNLLIHDQEKLRSMPIKRSKSYNDRYEHYTEENSIP